MFVIDYFLVVQKTKKQKRKEHEHIISYISRDFR